MEILKIGKKSVRSKLIFSLHLFVPLLYLSYKLSLSIGISAREAPILSFVSRRRIRSLPPSIPRWLQSLTSPPWPHTSATASYSHLVNSAISFARFSIGGPRATFRYLLRVFLYDYSYSGHMVLNFVCVLDLVLIWTVVRRFWLWKGYAPICLGLEDFYIRRLYLRIQVIYFLYLLVLIIAGVFVFIDGFVVIYEQGIQCDCCYFS